MGHWHDVVDGLIVSAVHFVLVYLGDHSLAADLHVLKLMLIVVVDHVLHVLVLLSGVPLVQVREFILLRSCHLRHGCVSLGWMFASRFVGALGSVKSLVSRGLLSHWGGAFIDWWRWLLWHHLLLHLLRHLLLRTC